MTSCSDGFKPKLLIAFTMKIHEYYSIIDNKKEKGVSVGFGSLWLAFGVLGLMLQVIHCIGLNAQKIVFVPWLGHEEI